MALPLLKKELGAKAFYFVIATNLRSILFEKQILPTPDILLVPKKTKKQHSNGLNPFEKRIGTKYHFTLLLHQIFPL